MKNGIFLNKQVSEIVGITPRQVLSWSEKGLILAFKESMGAGTKRGYDYINLLEFGLCAKLFILGFGFRAVRKIINDLRNRGLIKDWACDFTNYYRELYKRQKDAINETIKEERLKGKIDSVKTLEDLKAKFFQKPYKPDASNASVGILTYFFSGDMGEYLEIIAWNMSDVLNLNIIKQSFENSDCGLLINIGKIKKRIDNKI